VTKRGASTSGAAVPCEVRYIRREWPGCPAHPSTSPAFVLGCSSGRFFEERARVGPRLWSRIRKQLPEGGFVLAIWSSCRGPRRSAASELAVVPSAAPGSPSLNAWPAHPRDVLPRHELRPASLRAFCRVPSSVLVRACRQAPASVASPGSVYLPETGPKSLLGPIPRWRSPPAGSCGSRDGLQPAGRGERRR